MAITRTKSEGELKLARKYPGPYKIKRVLRRDRYIMEKVGQMEGPRMISTVVDHMKLWNGTFRSYGEEYWHLRTDVVGWPSMWKWCCPVLGMLGENGESAEKQRRAGELLAGLAAVVGEMHNVRHCFV